MRTIHLLRSLFSLVAVSFLLFSASATQATAQCPTVFLTPGISPCCFEIRMTNNVANTWINLEIQGNPGMIVGVANAPISNPPVPIGPGQFRFTPNGVMYWAAPIANVVIGSFCITGNTPLTIRVRGVNGQLCIYNFQLMCNGVGGPVLGNPVGGGGNPIGGGNVFPVLQKEGNVGDEGESNNVSSMTVAPNPASVQANLRVSSAQALHNVVLSISDITGRELLRVLEGANLSAGSYDIPMQTEGLASGMYQVRLYSEGTLLLHTTMSVLR